MRLSLGDIMKQSRKISHFILCLSLYMGLSGCTVTPQQYTPVDWVSHYDSVEEMIDASDAIVIATVSDQTTEIRVDMVFTMSTLEVSAVLKADEGIDVSQLTLLQTGGTKDGITTFPIEDVLMVKKGSTYLFFLEMTEEGHVLLMGGYQGIATVKSGKVVFPDNRAFTTNPLDRLTLQAVKDEITDRLN